MTVSSTRRIHKPWSQLPCPKSCPHHHTDDDTQGERHRVHAPSNLAKTHWFHSLPFQQFQALLTLFPKSFSPFPHGTCLLSVSSQYLALGEDYLPFSAPLPKYATLNDAPNATECKWTYGILTLYDTFFQKDLHLPLR